MLFGTNYNIHKIMEFQLNKNPLFGVQELGAWESTGPKFFFKMATEES